MSITHTPKFVKNLCCIDHFCPLLRSLLPAICLLPLGQTARPAMHNLTAPPCLSHLASSIVPSDPYNPSFVSTGDHRHQTTSAPGKGALTLQCSHGGQGRDCKGTVCHFCFTSEPFHPTRPHTLSETACISRCMSLYCSIQVCSMWCFSICMHVTSFVLNPIFFTDFV